MTIRRRSSEVRAPVTGAQKRALLCACCPATALPVEEPISRQVSVNKLRDELQSTTRKLSEYVRAFEDPQITASLKELDRAVVEVGKSWSGSWLGYHSRVYYANLKTPPAEANFSAEWGLDIPDFCIGSSGDWQPFEFDFVTQEIMRRAGNPDL